MKALRGLKLVAVLACLGTSVILGQDAGSAAPISATQTMPPAKVYDAGAGVTAPELIPAQWQVMAAGACTQVRDGLVYLTFVVDAGGVARDVVLENAQNTPVEKMALRIVAADRFRPGTLNGQAVAVNSGVEVNIDGCIDWKEDDAGNRQQVFRLTAQPVQKLAAPHTAKVDVPGANAAVGQQELPPGLSRVGGAVSAPVPLNHVRAEYSEEAKKNLIEGDCLISVTVDVHGNPQNPRVVRTLGGGLDRKAIEAVNKYKFKPAMKKDGTPVPVMIMVEVRFRLY
jgi:TonB family protein